MAPDLRYGACGGGRYFPPGRVLAIGDSIRTDMKGAVMNGFDALFIEGAISATESTDSESIADEFVKTGITPNWCAEKPGLVEPNRTARRYRPGLNLPHHLSRTCRRPHLA